MIARVKDLNNIIEHVEDYTVVGILGARQVGKTTIARQIASIFKENGKDVTFLDLENSEDLSRIQDPMLVLKHLKGLVVLDGIQRKPEIFATLRVLADRENSQTKFIVLGSASPHLLKQGSETLAGRIYFYELHGISIQDAGVDNSDLLWLRGGFPKAFTSSTDAKSFLWRRNFIRTFLERDLPGLGISVSSETMFRFWSMLAHYHGQIWNSSEFGRSFGVADTTVRGYLDKLADCFMVRILRPWHENISKRQVKAVKTFIIDSGITHNLLGIRTLDDLERHPKCGATWEGFVIGEIIRKLGVEDEECFFWATHAGLELDLMIVRGGMRIGFEIKRTSSPSVTASMKNAINDLNLKQLYVIHAGDCCFDMNPKIKAVPMSRILNEIEI
ncbi:MAG: ATP-binding protein [Victivallales bacterium]